MNLPLEFIEGIKHITDPGGIDHMVFLLALCAIYELKEWRQVLILATAFTLGHSFTLFAAGFDIVVLSGNMIEMAIPVTIFITALSNTRGVWRNGNTTDKGILRYVMALVFGMVHGFGFCNYFRMMRVEDESILLPLLWFNLGVEAGQIIIVLILMLLAAFIKGIFGIRNAVWILFVSGMAAGMAILLLLGLLLGN
jgi:hypothetical protein